MGIVGWREVGVHCGHNVFVLVGAGNGEHLGVRSLDHVGFGTEASGDNDLAVRLDSFANGFEAFIPSAVQEAAGIDQDKVCASIIWSDLVAFCAQARDDTL